MDPSTKYHRFLQSLDPEEHKSQSKSSGFKDQMVRGLPGVSCTTIGAVIKAYVGHILGWGEAVQSGSSNTVVYVPKKSIDEFRDRYNKTDEGKRTHLPAPS
jgi:hypothetical protein